MSSSSTPDRDQGPGPSVAGRDPGTPRVKSAADYVCSGTATTTGRPCVLAPKHAGHCESLRDLDGLNTPITVEPADVGLHRCDGCYRGFRDGDWMLFLADMRNRSDHQVTLCRDCAGSIARAAITMPVGPAPQRTEWCGDCYVTHDPRDCPTQPEDWS